MLCAAGTRAGESCNEHPILLSLPACEPRAEQTPDPDHPSEDAPWQGRSADGPTTICDVPRESSERRADSAGQPPEGSRIHRTGRAQKTTPQVVSELVPTAGKRQEAGAGESEAPSTGHFAREL